MLFHPLSLSLLTATVSSQFPVPCRLNGCRAANLLKTPFSSRTAPKLKLLLRGNVRMGDHSTTTGFHRCCWVAKLKPCAQFELATTSICPRWIINNRRCSLGRSFTTSEITCSVFLESSNQRVQWVRLIYPRTKRTSRRLAQRSYKTLP